MEAGELFKSDGHGEEYSEVGAVECEAYESLLPLLREPWLEEDCVDGCLLGYGAAISGCVCVKRLLLGAVEGWCFVSVAVGRTQVPDQGGTMGVAWVVFIQVLDVCLEQ